LCIAGVAQRLGHDEQYGEIRDEPMWQLLLLSLYIFAGGTADLFATAGFKRFARPSMESKQSAGQRLSPRKRSWLPKLG
jgi:hypothetical protein